jgi:hypothetical protein
MLRRVTTSAIIHINNSAFVIQDNTLTHTFSHLQLKYIIQTPKVCTCTAYTTTHIMNCDYTVHHIVRVFGTSHANTNLCMWTMYSLNLGLIFDRKCHQIDIMKWMWDKFITCNHIICREGNTRGSQPWLVKTPDVLFTLSIEWKLYTRM